MTGYSANQLILNKQYNVGGTPNKYSIFMGQNSTANGSWYCGIQTATTLLQLSIVATYAAIPLFQWTHLQCTYDGVTLLAYLNGIKVGSGALTGNIDWGSGGMWCVGSILSTLAWSGMINDLRVEGVTRSASYLRSLSLLGLNRS